MPVDVPEQIVCDEGVAIAVGIGFTNIGTSSGAPIHPLKVGVTVYVTVPVLLLVVFNTCAILEPVPADEPVAKDSLAVHPKVDPTGDELNAMPVTSPEQIVCDGGVAIAVGIGLTVISTSTGKPTQPVNVGVMV